MYSAFSNHRNTQDNLESSPFEFTQASFDAIQVLLKKYPNNYKSSAVIPSLFIAQKQNNNFLTLSAMNKVAKILEMTPMQVYEVASFYTMFNRTKVGKYHLQVCGTTPCMLRGVSSKPCKLFRLVKSSKPFRTLPILVKAKHLRMDSLLSMRSSVLAHASTLPWSKSTTSTSMKT
jgi:NADH:ubiquinone oxidoreductase subunit E